MIIMNIFRTAQWVSLSGEAYIGGQCVPHRYRRKDKVVCFYIWDSNHLALPGHRPTIPSGIRGMEYR